MDLIVKYKIEPTDFMNIRENVNWNYIPYDLVKKALDGSMINISIFDKDKCIGIERIVGDNVLKGMLTDVIVMKEYQNKGVGKIIVTSLIKKLNDQIKPGESFQLEASPTANNRNLYIKCGLKYKPENQDGVYLWIRK